MRGRMGSHIIGPVFTYTVHLLDIDNVVWLADGYSPFPSILAYFSDLSDSNLPPHWDIEQSLAEDSPTILIEAATGYSVCVCVCAPSYVSFIFFIRGKNCSLL